MKFLIFLTVSFLAAIPVPAFAQNMDTPEPFQDLVNELSQGVYPTTVQDAPPSIDLGSVGPSLITIAQESDSRGLEYAAMITQNNERIEISDTVSGLFNSVEYQSLVEPWMNENGVGADEDINVVLFHTHPRVDVTFSPIDIYGAAKWGIIKILGVNGRLELILPTVATPTDPDTLARELALQHMVYGRMRQCESLTTPVTGSETFPIIYRMVKALQLALYRSLPDDPSVLVQVDLNDIDPSSGEPPARSLVSFLQLTAAATGAGQEFREGFVGPEFKTVMNELYDESLGPWALPFDDYLSQMTHSMRHFTGIDGNYYNVLMDMTDPERRTGIRVAPLVENGVCNEGAVVDFVRRENGLLIPTESFIVRSIQGRHQITRTL